MQLLPSGPDYRATRGDGLSKPEAGRQAHTLRLYRMPSHERAARISGYVPDLPQFETVGEDEKEYPRLSQSGVGAEIAVLRLLLAKRSPELLQVLKDIQVTIQ